MNTPAHLIFGLTVFGKADQRRVTAAALAGALIPDLSLYLMAVWHLQVLDTPPQTVFGTLYFSDEWQSIFRIDNSMVLWGVALVLGLMWQSPVVLALCGAAVLHLIGDFALHHDDARAHFWPVSNWVFQSPLSYWDSHHFGNIVAPIEAISSLLCCVVLWRRYVGRWMRGLFVTLGVLELAPVVIFAVMFAGGSHPN